MFVTALACAMIAALCDALPPGLEEGRVLETSNELDACTASATPDGAGEVTIVAFGDSTTAPRGSLRVYPTVLEDALCARGIRARVINAGVPANTTAMARERFEKNVLNRNPALVIISLGINDAAIDVWKDVTAPRVPIKDYERNLRYFVAELQKRGSAVVLFTPNPLCWTPQLKELYGKPPYDTKGDAGLNFMLDRYAEVMRRVAEEVHAPLVDTRKGLTDLGKRLGMGELLLDGIHPSDRAHRFIADRLLDCIVPLLAHMNRPEEP